MKQDILRNDTEKTDKNKANIDKTVRDKDEEKRNAGIKSSNCGRLFCKKRV